MAAGGGGGGGSGAAIAGAASSAVGMIPALIGRGKNNREAGNFGDSKQYDPNAGLYGGRAGVEDETARRMQQSAGQWQGKADEYGAQQQGLYNGGQAAMQQQQAARGMQMDAAGMARARATGAVPSIAQQQTDRGIARVGQQASMARQQAFAQQASQAASARGAAGLALAGQQAANNTANAGASISQNQFAQQADMANAGAVAASQERLAAEQAYAQQAGAVRGGDVSAAQTQYGAAAQAGQLGLGAGQLGLGYQNAETNMRLGSMQGRNQQQATLASSYNQSEQLNQQTANQNAEKKGLIDTVTDLFPSDANTKMYLGGGGPQSFGGFGTLGGAMAGATQQDPVNNASAYKLDPSGGMDVDATIRQQAESGTKFVNDPTGGMVAGARADGGPVAGGEPYLVGERGPEIVVPSADGTVIPNHAISTWGTGGPDVAAQDAAAVQAGTQANTAAFAAQEAANWKNPYQRDLDSINAQRNASRLLGQDSGLTADDKRRERVAKAFLGTKPEEEPEAAKNKPPEESIVDGGPGRAPLWGEGMGQSSPDPPNAEAAMNPWMLALQSASRSLNEAQFGSSRTERRADGGPVKAGQPYMMGERGPEVVMPLSNPNGYELRQSEDGHGYYDRASQDIPTMVPARFAGGLQSGGQKAEAPKAAKAKAKSKGGSVDLDKLAADLERSTKREWDARLAQGPAIKRLEDGTPENGYTTQLTEGGEAAYQRWRAKNSPWDTGQDYDLRGAFADGLERDGRLHLPDTYKKPNHETFSVESKYAEHAPDEAGSWDGERYQPKGPPAWLRQEVRGREIGEASRVRPADALAGAPYVYKPEYRPPEQAPGEVNVGPTAQTMLANPATATAVKRDPTTGLLEVDANKLTKVNSSAIADLQKQIDGLALNAGGRR